MTGREQLIALLEYLRPRTSDAMAYDSEAVVDEFLTQAPPP